jgi:hypothetical protein
MIRPKRILPLLVLLLLTLSAFLSPQTNAQQPTTSTLQGDTAHPAHAIHWVDTKLYFGLGPADDPSKGVSEAQWRDFLDKEVTPRFPSGLSVIDIYGQWQRRQQTTTERERSKLLVIDYPATPDNNARIEAIRTAWKQSTHAQSVLKVTQPADVSF